MYLKFILMYFCSIWYVTCQYSGASLIIWTSLIRIIHLSGHLFSNQSLFHLCENSMFCASDAVKFDLWTLPPPPWTPTPGSVSKFWKCYAHPLTNIYHIPKFPVFISKISNFFLLSLWHYLPLSRLKGSDQNSEQPMHSGPPISNISLSFKSVSRKL